MQYHSIKGVVALTHYGGESHLGNFNKMIEDLVVHPERNKTIANILLAAYDVQFLLITSIHKQVELLDELLLGGEKFYTMTHDDVEELIAGDPNMDIHRFQTRLLAISFVAFDKLISHFSTMPVGSSNILDGLGGFVVGTPHKNIDNIIEYAYTYHNSTSKHKHGNQIMGSQFRYVLRNSCSMYDIADNHELLSMWATWHEDKYLRLKLMDPNPPIHHEESKDTTNIILPKDHKAHIHYNQKYHGVLNDLGTPSLNTASTADMIALLGTKDSPLSVSNATASRRPSNSDSRSHSPSPMGIDHHRIPGSNHGSPSASNSDASHSPRRHSTASTVVDSRPRSLSPLAPDCKVNGHSHGHVHHSHGHTYGHQFAREHK